METCKRPTMTTASRPSIAMIGGGRMALALAEGFVRGGLVDSTAIRVFDPDAAARTRLKAAVPGVRLAASPAEAIGGATLVILAVKPQQAAAACADLAAALGRSDGPSAGTGPTVLSIVAGLSTASLVGMLGSPRVVRVMPNTPSLVGRGVSAICVAPEVPADDRALVRALLSAVGRVHEVDENLMDAVTGLSGSGPGFIARLVEALAEGGVRAGLPADLALELAVGTLAGTGALIESTGEHPAQIRIQVTSPGGTTQAGLELLEERGVPEALAAAVVAAARRASELGQAPGPGPMGAAQSDR
jgi:pyrroline-5-carboxylate reductase